MRATIAAGSATPNRRDRVAAARWNGARAKPRPPVRRAALTLIECLFSVVIVGVMLVAAVHTVAGSRLAQARLVDNQHGVLAAEDLLAEIMSLPYDDPEVVSAALGREPGESATDRMQYDDVDDYHSFSENPPTDREGRDLDSFKQWTRSVAVTWVAQPVGGVTIAPTPKLVTVTASRNGGFAVRVAGVRTDGLPPLEACCLPKKTCEQLPVSSCTGKGGTSKGVDTECWTIECIVEPIANWEFNESSGTTATDSAGDHDGTLYNGPVWRTGKRGNAILLDGANDYINVKHADTLSITKEFTLSACFNAGSLTSYRTILHKGTTTTQRNYFLQTDGSELSTGFYLPLLGLQRFTTTGLGLVRNRWYHVAVTHSDADNVVRILVNGTQKGQWTTLLAPVANTGDLTIGKSPYGDYWDGLLDDVRIYDRVLTDAEIAALAGI